MADETSDAVSREAAWLAQSYDSLPALLKSAGGQWDLVQAYWPGDGRTAQLSGIYVTRARLDDDHPSAWRYRPRHTFRLKLIWPVTADASSAEAEQQNFDNAIGDLLTRIRGPQGDKTHGGRFLSVAAVPMEGSVSVVSEDPETTIPAGRELRALVTYHADDSEFSG
jgi:hypothetical protein